MINKHCFTYLFLIKEKKIFVLKKIDTQKTVSTQFLIKIVEKKKNNIFFLQKYYFYMNFEARFNNLGMYFSLILFITIRLARHKYIDYTDIPVRTI